VRDIQDFDSILIKLASPEQVRAWSTEKSKNLRPLTTVLCVPRSDGLFCERIFGTTKEWECYCGKFKSIRYKGVICDRCGVEVTHPKVRRERMGHIELASPFLTSGTTVPSPPGWGCCWIYLSRLSVYPLLREIHRHRPR
jgi:DNA-directed RNA polymerase subunit beta'